MFPKLAACANQAENGREANPHLGGSRHLCEDALPENEGRVGSDPLRRIESHAWDDLQVVVRSFRQAIKRGERPAIEVYAPEGIPDRKALLLELVHEETRGRDHGRRVSEPCPVPGSISRDSAAIRRHSAS